MIWARKSNHVGVICMDLYFLIKKCKNAFAPLQSYRPDLKEYFWTKGWAIFLALPTNICITT